MENIFVDLFLRLKRILHHFTFQLLFFKKSNALIFGSDIFAMNSSLKCYLSSPPNQHALFWQVWARRLLIIIAYETLIVRRSFTFFLKLTLFHMHGRFLLVAIVQFSD